MLRSAIENVVRNGVRFTPESTAVDVSIRRERDRAVIRVRDRGPGVPENKLSEIFLASCAILCTWFSWTVPKVLLSFD
jgi:signal transduction histidine kinase